MSDRIIPLYNHAGALSQAGVQNEHVAAILDGARDLAGLIETMQQLQDFESGRVAVDKTAVDLPGLIDGAVSELKTVYGDLVRWQCENSLTNPMVGVDSELMAGAFQNLLQHAVEHVAPLAENVVVVEMANGDNQVVVTVRYGGESVSPEQLSTFFEKFNADMPNTDGTGLETNYAYLVATAHGGEISVVSDDTIGTAVTVKLPQA